MLGNISNAHPPIQNWDKNPEWMISSLKAWPLLYRAALNGSLNRSLKKTQIFGDFQKIRQLRSVKPRSVIEKQQWRDVSTNVRLPKHLGYKTDRWAFWDEFISTIAKNGLRNELQKPSGVLCWTKLAQRPLIPVVRFRLCKMKLQVCIINPNPPRLGWMNHVTVRMGCVWHTGLSDRGGGCTQISDTRVKTRIIPSQRVGWATNRLP